MRYEIVSSLAPAPELPFSPRDPGDHTPLPSSPGHGIGLPSPRLGIETLFRYSPATERQLVVEVVHEERTCPTPDGGVLLVVDGNPSRRMADALTSNASTEVGNRRGYQPGVLSTGRQVRRRGELCEKTWVRQAVLAAGCWRFSTGGRSWYGVRDTV